MKRNSVLEELRVKSLALFGSHESSEKRYVQGHFVDEMLEYKIRLYVYKREKKYLQQNFA